MTKLIECVYESNNYKLNIIIPREVGLNILLNLINNPVVFYANFYRILNFMTTIDDFII